MTSPFDPVSFRHGPDMANRFVLAPLTNRQSHADGTLSDDEHRWLVARGRGGFGLTMTCAAHVQAIGQGFPGQLGVFDDRHLEGLTRLAADLDATGTVSYVQLHHAGNRSPAELIGATPVSASDDPETGARGLSTAEVEHLRDDFVAAAVRAERAGFHGVELHGAHGYVLCQFLSSELNHRDDHYGGSLENRARLLFEIIDGVRSNCSDDLALAVRLSPERFGMVVPEIIEVFGRLVDDGRVDMIDMSLWDCFKPSIVEGYEDRELIDIFAELPRGDVRLGVAGKLRTADDVRRALDRGVDLPILGRAAILHHDFPERMRADPDFEARLPPVAADVLADEFVSPSFVTYLAETFRFVEDPDAA